MDTFLNIGPRNAHHGYTTLMMCLERQIGSSTHSLWQWPGNISVSALAEHAYCMAFKTLSQTDSPLSRNSFCQGGNQRPLSSLKTLGNVRTKAFQLSEFTDNRFLPAKLRLWIFPRKRRTTTFYRLRPAY